MQEKGDAQKNDRENTATIVDGDMGIVYNESFVNLTCHTSDWLINSSALFHITAHRDYFTSYVNGDYGHVRMGNEGASKIVLIRDICLETSIGCKLSHKDVRYVPDIRLNLISTGNLDDEGYINQSGKRKLKLTKGSLVLTNGGKVNTFNMIEAKINEEVVNVAVKDFDIKTWYKWFGHISEKGLETIFFNLKPPEWWGV